MAAGAPSGSSIAQFLDQLNARQLGVDTTLAEAVRELEPIRPLASGLSLHDLEMQKFQTLQTQTQSQSQSHRRPLLDYSTATAASAGAAGMHGGAPGTQQPAAAAAAAALDVDEDLLAQIRLYRQREAILAQELKAARHEARLWQQRAESQQDHINTVHEELHAGREAKQRLDSLERYLESMMTREEQQSMQDQLTRVERDYRVALDENAEAAAVIGKLKSKLEAKDAELTAHQEEIEELRRNVLEARDSKMGAITELQGLVKQLTLERNSARDMYDKVAKELTTQVAEQQSLRQLLDMERAKMEQMARDSADREAYMQELQQREKDSIAELRNLERAVDDGELSREQLLKRISAQALTIDELRDSIKALTEQNQVLISQNQTLRLGGRVPVEDLAAAIRMSSSEATASAVRGEPNRYVTPAEIDALQDELAAATDEMMQLYDVVRSRFQQYEADAQRLLGLLNPRKTLPPLFTRTSDMATRLEVVREVRGHLNALKGEMVDQFAREVGTETCQMQ